MKIHKLKNERFEFDEQDLQDLIWHIYISFLKYWMKFEKLKIRQWIEKFEKDKTESLEWIDVSIPSTTKGIDLSMFWDLLYKSWNFDKEEHYILDLYKKWVTYKEIGCLIWKSESYVKHFFWRKVKPIIEEQKEKFKEFIWLFWW